MKRNDSQITQLVMAKERDKAFKIFVIGKNRSGTKWISNILSNHPEIVSVQREGAGGILESGLFDNMSRMFGSLKNNASFIAFIECYSQDNYFKITGLDKNVLYRGPRDYLDFLCYVLDLYAKKKNKRFWIQKTSTIHFEKLYNKYLDAKFIAIIRDPVDNIKSSIGLKKTNYINSGKINRHFSKGILRLLISYVFEKKNIDKFAKKENVYLVKFNDLKYNREKTTKEICNFLDIQYNDCLLEDKYKKNTSFDGKVSKKDIMNRFDIFIIKLLYPILNLLPPVIFKRIFNFYQKSISGSTSNKFIPKAFEIKINELKKMGINLED